MKTQMIARAGTVRAALHVDEIDVLRAIAVSAVVISHVLPEYVTGGFLGVDMFFVISGFLITHSTLRNDQGQFSSITFWRRRITRIVPPLFVLTVLTAIAGRLIIVTPNDHATFFGSLPYQAFFAQNFFFNQEHIDYFRGLSEANLNLHLWSIAIEEQFYVVFPFLVLAALSLSRSAFRTRLAVFVAALAILSLLLPLITGDTDARYYLTQYRIYELCMGVLIALAVMKIPPGWLLLLPRGAILIEAIAVTALAFLFVAVDEPRTRYIFIACVSVAVLILIAVAGRSVLLNTAARLPAVSAVGRASYSIYLWHWPLYAVLKYTNHDFGTYLYDLAAYAVLLVVFSTASFLLLEKKLRFWFHDRAFVWLALFAATNLGIYAIETNAAGARFAKAAPILQSAQLSPHCGKHWCEHGTGNRTLILWGDSHARALWTVMTEIADATGQKLVGVFRCVPGRRDEDICDDHHRRVLQLVDTGNISTILLVGRWSQYTAEGRFFSHNGVEPKSRQQMADVFRRAFSDLVSDFAGQRMAILLQVPQYPFLPPREMLVVDLGMRLRPLPVKTLQDHRRDHSIANDYFTKLADGTENITTIDPADVLCASGICNYQTGGLSLYWDKDHLSVRGSLTLRDMMLKALAPGDLTP